MTHLLLLALIGIIESVVHLFRYRTAGEPSHWVSAGWGMAIAATRLGFIWIGASAVLAEASPWAGLLAYCVPVGITTALLHRALERRKGLPS